MISDQKLFEAKKVNFLLNIQPGLSVIYGSILQSILNRQIFFVVFSAYTVYDP